MDLLGQRLSDALAPYSGQHFKLYCGRLHEHGDECGRLLDHLEVETDRPRGWNRAVPLPRAETYHLETRWSLDKCGADRYHGRSMRLPKPEWPRDLDFDSGTGIGRGRWRCNACGADHQRRYETLVGEIVTAARAGRSRVTLHPDPGGQSRSRLRVVGTLRP